jgi:non-specific protein-tyrosine kinase
LLFLLADLSGTAAFLISSKMTPVYQASATLLVNEAPATSSKTDFTSLQTSERLARTYAQLMTKQPVLDVVIQRLELNLDVRTLKEMIQVQPVRDTQLIAISVEDTDRMRAALIANALGSIFAEQNQALQASRYAASEQNIAAQLQELELQIQETNVTLSTLTSSVENQTERDRLETVLAQHRQTYALLLQSYEQVRLAEAQSLSNVVQAEAAALPTEPVRPRTVVNTLLGTVFGLVLSIGVIFLIEAMDDTVHGPDEIHKELGLPVLGMIPSHETENKRPVTSYEPRSPVSEAFRSLRTNLQFASLDQPLRTILVTSPSPGEGKSTISANLAVVLAQGNRSVILLDTDMRRPTAHRILGLSNHLGLSGLILQLVSSLNGNTPLEGSLQESGVRNLKVLTSGKIPPNPAELLGSELFDKLISILGKEANNMVLDSAPVLAVTDAAVIAARVDGVLLVLKPGKTKLMAAKGAVEQLRQVGANLVGVVLNDIDFKRSHYYYYRSRGYYYNYNGYYGKPAAEGKKERLQGGILVRLGLKNP